MLSRLTRIPQKLTLGRRAGLFSICNVFNSSVQRRHFSEISNFPGAKSEYTLDMDWKESHEIFKCFRRTDQLGNLFNPDYKIPLSNEQLVEMYSCMVQLNAMDNVFYNAQRQGRVSFYMTCYGEEAIHIGSAAAIEPQDMVYAQYREAGVLMYRGWNVQDFAHQLFSNQKDLGKGRQMPVHYGSRELNYHTISSPLGTQIPQAVGAAYGFKREKADKIAVCYFGDGAASEGDFHAAVNFASTLKAPVMFFCRNNGYAISTPVHEQYGGDGIAGRGPAFGIKTIRIDGNDLLAVFDATKEGRRIAQEEQRPVLIEAMTYRAGHHSTSDDSTRYRSKEELLYWMEDHNALNRTRMFLESRGLWDGDQEVQLQKKCRQTVMDALSAAETEKKPARTQLFSDVYDSPPKHLQEQEKEMLEHIAKYSDKYPLGDYQDEETYHNPADDVLPR
mmetsp:Transcript_22323/g.31538  ORF Transcript_22323/g.31538 Transcript_22323/m.31538 type:complete len:446 (-) Transcript_22323:113-1450(-)